MATRPTHGAAPRTLPRRAKLSIAADSCGVSVKTFRRAISRGDLTGYRFGQRIILVDLDELDAMLRNGFYNETRRHSTIGMVSPITYENTAAPNREAA